MAVAIRLDADRVVEVARRRRVDGDRLEREEIGALAVGLACARRAAGLPQRGLRPLPRKAALQQQRTQHVLDVVGRAQPLDDARTAPARSTATSSPACTACPERRPSASC